MNRPLSDEEFLQIIESDEFWEEDESDCVENLNKKQDIKKEDKCRAVKSDQEEVGELETSHHDSDSEQECEPPNNDEESKSESDTDADLSKARKQDNGRVLHGRDKTKWATAAPVRGKIAAINIIKILPGLKGAANQNKPNSVLYSWSLLATDISSNIL
nr:unnamed protein product [Callosobruchus chinensis]